MRKNYTVERIPYELEKDRSRAYFAPNTLREMRVKPGTHIRLTRNKKTTVLRAVPKFDGDEGAIYLPSEEIVYLEARAGETVQVEKDEEPKKEASCIRIHFSYLKKTIETLERIRLVLEDKKIIYNNQVILGGAVEIEGEEDPVCVTESTKIEIKTQNEKESFPLGQEKEAEQIIKSIEDALSGDRKKPRGVVVSGEMGMGKRTVCTYALGKVGREWIKLRPDTKISKGVFDAYEYAKINEPCTIWIESLDRLFGEEPQKGFLCDLESIMEDIYKENRRICILATVKSSLDLPGEVKLPFMLDKEIFINPPTLPQREAQIHYGVSQYKQSSGCLCEPQEKIKHLSKRTAGFSRAQIYLLLRESLYPQEVPEEAYTAESYESIDGSEKQHETSVNLDEDADVEQKIKALSITSKEHLSQNACDGLCMRRLSEQVVRTVPSASNEKSAEVPDITFSSIFGQEGAKSKLLEAVVWPVKYRSIFQELDVIPTKGVLLYGPPGCGKTLLAQALANESGAVFFSIRGPEIMGKYVGESEERLRKVFSRARAQTPSIIFIDEIDSIAPHREAEGGQVDKRVVSTLLTEMDGVGVDSGLFVLGATNKPWSIDSALMRPGRFDHHILVDLPDAETKKMLLQKRLHKLLRNQEQWIEEENTEHDLQSTLFSSVFQSAESFTGAELISMINEISLEVIRIRISGKKVTSASLCEMVKKRAFEIRPRIFPEEMERFRAYQTK
ncbi:transitional endoplasmic reticulum ATPase [Nematocida sp. LUAm3]|nr:transitional endoplasmic reticulum ATPase [Nematocida sp. LUAm3]KAI5176052.1 transitional endoplasmic reticulum ATPase [Nematocida sp. LUAm2]KAI5177096.1 transitional endoplasmic reticulum ATPase [Nematocida sp. LUAm1]